MIKETWFGMYASTVASHAGTVGSAVYRYYEQSRKRCGDPLKMARANNSQSR
jgi:hypothetical protein